MSYISLLRQKIKVIQTIKKTTSAMRLAARAIQARLRKKELIFNKYIASIEHVYRQYSALINASQTLSAESSSENQPVANTTMVLLIGSHKGLCGAFNERLFAFFNKSVTLGPKDIIVTVGTQASQFIRSKDKQPFHHFDHFTSTTLVSIAQQLTQLFVATQQLQLIIVSNQPRTFFLQQPHAQTLELNFASSISSQANHNLGLLLARLRLRGRLLKVLYDSLMAEQSARFLSMDSATRNAEDILHQTKIDYNKLRQALVTRELLELTTDTLPE
jgi:F-type H+-transporting ATPase subunit gamma